jgi:hypothetical protein
MAARRQLVPSTRLVLLTPGRSGSTLLLSLLASTPGFRWDEEVLRTAKGDPTALLRRRAMRAAAAGYAAWGTSVHPEHLYPLLAEDPVEWVGRLHDSGYELVTLLRRNPLQHVLSAAIAWERSEWHYTAGDEPATEPIRLDPVSILREAALAERSAKEVRAMVADRSHLALFYEDDLRDSEGQQHTANRVLAYLGLPPAAVSTPLRRRPVGLLEQIANVDEVVTALRATRYAPFLDELD